jgi:hypothetical protein
MEHSVDHEEVIAGCRDVPDVVESELLCVPAICGHCLSIALRAGALDQVAGGIQDFDGGMIHITNADSGRGIGQSGSLR